MEFDKTNVYSIANADEVNIGSSGYFADNLADLKKQVEKEEPYGTLCEVTGEENMLRFLMEEEGKAYMLFYPIAERARPYKDANEMIEDFKKRFPDSAHGKIPLIWIKCADNWYLVTRFTPTSVTITFADTLCTISLDILYKSYTYEDGSTCGITN